MSTPQSLPWFSGLAATPAETTTPFDLTLIQPVSTVGISPNDLLEVTIWDLYEPGKPHTFPSRVDATGKITVPHLDPLQVTGSSAAEVEAQLIENYRDNDVLKQPRILVRELASAPLHVYVTGSVQRPGLLNLSRRNASVFAALVSAGGLSRNAGMHVFVSDQTAAKPAEPIQAATPAGNVPTELPLVTGNSGIQLATEIAPGSTPAGVQKPRVPHATETVRFQSEPPPQSLSDLDLNEQFSTGHSAAEVNSLPDQPVPNLTELNPKNQPLEESIATRPDRGQIDPHQTRPGQWYDLTAEHDRDQLKCLVLRDGDVITVRAAAPPVRITGAVVQPGPYRTPASNSLTIIEAVELAGGLSVRDKSVSLILTRPAAGDRGLQRWTFHMGDGQPLPGNAPFIQPGDILHIEPTAKARVQGMVDAFRPSKW